MDLPIDLPRWVVETMFVVYAIVVTGVVVLERRRPTATLALILALVFVPVLGLVVYVLLSRRRVTRRRRQRMRRVDPVERTRSLATIDGLPSGLTREQAGLVRLALEAAAAPLRRADLADLLPTAATAWDALSSAIEAAERTIHLEFYIWRADASGRALTALLTEKARRGVKVRILYDHLGSLRLADAHFGELREAGGEVAVFGRLHFPLLANRRLNFRNHRKIMTVDGRVGFVGGLNVADEYLSRDTTRVGWRDLFVRLEGDAVIGLEATFLDDWLASTGQVLDLEGIRRQPIVRRHRRGWPRRRRKAAGLPPTSDPFDRDRPVSSRGPLCQIIPSGPDLPVASVLEMQITAAIASAQQRVYIATPYLIPDEPLMLVLRAAGMRGVDVRILVPDPIQNDLWLVAFASRSYYDDLLDSGCRLFEYLPGMLHAKYLIVDDVSAIGSANMDIRSFHLNYEITGMFYDAPLSAALAQVFTEDLGRAREVLAEERENLSLPRRLLEASARVLSPLL